MSVACPGAGPPRRPVTVAATLGGPEVAHVFVHDIAWFLRREGEHYPGTRPPAWAERALVMARAQDVVCLLEPVDPDFQRYLAALGIGPRPERVVTVGRDGGADSLRSLAERLARDDDALGAVAAMVANARDVVLDPFIATADDVHLAEMLGKALQRPVRVLGAPPDVTVRVNRKDRARAKAAELGVPLAPGELVELPVGADGRPADLSPLAQALARRTGTTGRALVRGAWGAAGTATFVAVSGREHEVVRAVAARKDNRVYLVDALLDVRVSPNILMHVAPPGGAITWVGATDQRLDAALVHRGNVFPSRARTLADMVESAWRLARWLQSEGVAGLVGFDFCEYRDPATGRDEHFLAEVNARVNGAAYPTFLLDAINRAQARHGRPRAEAFLSAQTLPTGARSFSQLLARHASALFDPATGRGCVPFNTGHLGGGVCSGAFLGPTIDDVVRMHDAWLAAAGSPAASPQPAGLRAEGGALGC